MGYDLHITRRADWSETGNDITTDEWLAYVRTHPGWKINGENGAYFATWERAGESEACWLDWHEGNLYTKDPTPELIAQMLAIAATFGARVQGDDGEFYPTTDHADQAPAGETTQPPRSWIYRLFGGKPKAEAIGLPFNIGDRVRDSFGNLHTVLEIDPKAECGLGKVVTRRDDGTVHRRAAAAHGLEPVTKD